MRGPIQHDASTLQHHRTIFDGWRSISIALYMSLVGYGVLVGIPVISTAWVELLGFSEVQVGRVAGADLGGLSIGAVITAMMVGKFNRRYLVLLGAAIAIASNGLCMVFTGYEEVLWLRLFAGIGSGIYTAVAVATLGGSSKPAMAYNMMLFAFAFSQALEMQVLPLLPMNGIYMAFIGTFGLGLAFLHWVPAHPEARALDVELDVQDESGEHHIEHKHVPAYIPWMCLGAIFFTYVNIGAYWTYIDLAASGAEIDGELVNRLFVWGSLCSILGCLIATVISNRFGLAKPLFVALTFMAIAVGMLASGITEPKIIVSIMSFNLLWIFVDVYQMATVANTDHSGAFAALIPGAQGLGQIVGPNLAASILAASWGYTGVFLLCGAAALTGMAVYAVMYLRLRATIPALADAS